MTSIQFQRDQRSLQSTASHNLVGADRGTMSELTRLLFSELVACEQQQEPLLSWINQRTKKLLAVVVAPQ